MPADDQGRSGTPECRLIPIRQGQTPCTVEGRFCGSHDSTLAPIGERMAEAIGRPPALHGVDAVVSSPAQRARCTAEIIAEPHDRPVAIDDRFPELHFGRWESPFSSEVPVASRARPLAAGPSVFLAALRGSRA